MQKRQLRKAVFLAATALLTLLQLQTALAMPTVSAVEALIKSSNDTRKIKNIRAGIAQNDVIISTFREQSSSENDLKIDAVLLARLLIKKYAEISRVVINYYSPANPENYLQAVVSKPDIVAFGSGNLSHKDLLAAIRLEPKGPPPSKEKHSTKHSKAHSKVAANPNEAQWETCTQIPEISFLYLTNWKSTISPESSNILKMHCDDKYLKSEAYIDLFVMREKSIQEAEAAQAIKNSRQLKYTPQTAYPASENVGVGHNISAYCVEFTAVRKNDTKPRLRRQLFFFLGNKVYMCQLACAPEDRAFYSTFLEKFLGSLRAQQ